jgi:hypothetical protein
VIEPESALLAELLDDAGDDFYDEDLDDYEWYDATDGRPRAETIRTVGGVL